VGVGASGALQSDDEAATRKGMQESQTRILELEDNVRHLNEALQKQGHVAAETALEGLNSVSEAIKEIINLVDPEEGAEGAGQDTTTAAGAEAAGQNTSAATAAEGADQVEPAASAGSSSDSSTAAASAGQDAGGAGMGAAAGSKAESGGTGVSDPFASAADPAAPGAAAVGSSTNQAAAGRAAATAGGGKSGAGASLSGRLGGPESGATTDGDNNKAEKEVSWLQGNLWAVAVGILAFIVLVVAWILRRAGAAKRNAFESDSPITDSMVREKLREIDLDLDSPTGKAGRSPL